MEQLGQPFYSTKDKGTGLGLMISYNIIQNHKGTIEVSSQPKEGTTFEVKLPLSHAEYSRLRVYSSSKLIQEKELR